MWAGSDAFEIGFVGPRRERDARLFLDRKAVDVGPQHHRLARLSGVEQRHHSRLRGTRLELQAEFAQALEELPARLVLAEAHLRVAVEVTPELDHLVEHRPAGQRRR
jgi:hypothetical protein